MKILLAAIAILALPGCASMSATREGVRVDHLVIGISSLELGASEIASLCGVRAVFGGGHPDMGTHNALITIGPQAYLEVLAPQPDAVLLPELGVLHSLDSLTPMTWAVATNDAPATRQRLREAGFESSAPNPGTRTTPEGTTLRWYAFIVNLPDKTMAPFFIQWDPASPHPAATSPPGCTLAGIEIRTPDADTLQRLVDVLGVAVTVSKSEQPQMVVRLSGARGPVELRPRLLTPQK
jgi:hypothetical protein